MTSILGRAPSSNGSPLTWTGRRSGAPSHSSLAAGYFFGLVVVICRYQHSSVPAGCVLSSSSTRSDHLAFVAFLSPSPLSRPRLSFGAKTPAKGACSPVVLMLLGVLLSNVVKIPPQLAGPAP